MMMRGRKRRRRGVQFRWLSGNRVRGDIVHFESIVRPGVAAP